ncbi:MAG: hypothetical protein U5J83_10140 [Bryobacterales bacterium]|nr:hypothetical protein [Bryobacterales bacterium]
MAEAIVFHHSIGGERKAARLRYLRARWTDRIRKYPQVKLLTSDDRAQSCGIGVFEVEGMEALKISARLYESWRIVNHRSSGCENEYSGLRITPNVYSTLHIACQFADAMEEILTRAFRRQHQRTGPAAHPARRRESGAEQHRYEDHPVTERQAPS